MTSQRSPKAKVVAHLETLADRAILLSVPAFVAFMAIAFIHVA
jgi:hypothetical protein